MTMPNEPMPKRDEPLAVEVKCAHAPCDCTGVSRQMIERDGLHYCSEECADGAGASGRCACGHAGCASSAQTAQGS